MALSLSATNLTVQVGQEGAVQVVLIRTNLNESIQLTISNLPAGATGTFSVPSLPSNATSSTLTITPGRFTPPGTYTTVVTASAASVNAQVVPLALTITALPSISVVAKPNSLSVIQGGTGSIALDVSRTNFPEAVAFTSSGEPPGVTTTFPGAPTTSSVAAASFAVASNVETGQYPITITSTGNGVATVTSRLQLTVRSIPVPAIAVTVTPGALPVQQNTQGSALITIQRTDYEGVVTLVANGLPEGAVATFSPPATTSSFVTATFFAGSNTPLGLAKVTVTASGMGVPNTSDGFDLIVSAVPAIAVSAQPESLSATPGITVTTAISVARSTFPGPVSLSVTALPAGVTASFSANPTTATSADLVLAIDTTALAGTYLLKVGAAATGVAPVETDIKLTIAGAPVTGGNVTWQFCPVSAAPLWLAVQDGSGPWTRVAAGPGSTYRFQIGTSGGVAVVTAAAGGLGDLHVWYGTRAELITLGATRCGPAATKQISGTVAGFGVDEKATVWIGSSSGSAITVAPAFTVAGVPDGVRDLIAVRTDLTGTTRRLLLQRDLSPPDGSSVGTLDLAAGASFAPATATITLAGLNAGEQSQAGVTYLTPNGSAATIAVSPLGAATSFVLSGVVAARQITGDLHAVSVASRTTAGGEVSVRTVESLTQAFGAQTLTLGAALAPPAFSTTATTPHLRVRALVATQPDYTSGWRVTYAQHTGSTTQTMVIEATGSYAGAPGTIALEVPDFSAVSGWNNAWVPQAGVALTYTVLASEWGASGFARPAVAGTQLHAATRSGTFVP